MQRPITSFGLDDAGDPIAILSCGHPQHVRHQPPFINRPWVTNDAGRRSKLGETLNCVRCDRFELPGSFRAYARSREFTQESMPARPARGESTDAGIWARLVVLDGRLRYTVDALSTAVELSAQRSGVVVPEVPYRVEPIGAVRFFVEWYRSPARAD